MFFFLTESVKSLIDKLKQLVLGHQRTQKEVLIESKRLRSEPEHQEFAIATHTTHKFSFPDN